MTGDEVDFSEMDCRLFVDGAPSREALSSWIAAAVAGVTTRNGVRAGGLEIYVENNNEAGDEDKTVRKGGFLFFDNTAEVYFAPTAHLDGRVGIVTAILEDLWRRGFPAVAACDYEDRLPRDGGTADTAPWPAHVGD